MTNKANVPPSTSSGTQPVMVHCWQCNHSEGSLTNTWTLCDMCSPLFEEAQHKTRGPNQHGCIALDVATSKKAYPAHRSSVTCASPNSKRLNHNVCHLSPLLQSQCLYDQRVTCFPSTVPKILPEYDPYDFISQVNCSL